MTLLWNDTLSEDIDRGYAVKFLSFGKRDEFGMYVETITDGRLTRYYAQVNAYGIIASEEYDKVEIPDGWDDELWAATWLDHTYGGSPAECSQCYREGSIVLIKDCYEHEH